MWFWLIFFLFVGLREAGFVQPFQLFQQVCSLFAFFEFNTICNKNKNTYNEN